MESPRWSVRVRATVDGSASALARTHRFEVGEAAPFDVAAPQVSGLEYALGALGAELAQGLLVRARRSGLASPAAGQHEDERRSEHEQRSRRAYRWMGFHGVLFRWLLRR